MFAFTSSINYHQQWVVYDQSRHLCIALAVNIKRTASTSITGSAAAARRLRDKRSRFLKKYRQISGPQIHWNRTPGIVNFTTYNEWWWRRLLMLSQTNEIESHPHQWNSYGWLTLYFVGPPDDGAGCMYVLVVGASGRLFPFQHSSRRVVVYKEVTFQSEQRSSL